MKVYTLEDSVILPISLAQAWDFFSNPLNLPLITPPSLGLRIVGEVSPRLEAGTIIEYRVSPLLGIAQTWLTEITHVEEGHFFVDEQRFGPYKFWHHRHAFEEQTDGVLVKDLVRYALPFAPFGDFFHSLLVKPKLDEIFSFRRRELSKRFGELR